MRVNSKFNNNSFTAKFKIIGDTEDIPKILIKEWKLTAKKIGSKNDLVELNLERANKPEPIKNNRLNYFVKEKTNLNIFAFIDKERISKNISQEGETKIAYTNFVDFQVREFLKHLQNKEIKSKLVKIRKLISNK